MRRLERVKSQHFVASPRKTPFKRSVNRHASKKRRVGSNPAQPMLQSAHASSDEASEGEDEADPLSMPGPSRHRQVLSSEAGQQTMNQSRSRSKRKDRQSTGGSSRNRAEWKEARDADVFDSPVEDSSPKKRKRRGRDIDSRSETSSSWVEMDEDEEEEPEFIAESDQHLLQDAPGYALHRLRKAELIRLWKVAGMWSEGDDGEGSVDSMNDDEAEGQMSKKELVDGLIAARRRRSLERKVSIDAPPSPPSRRRSTFESPISSELKRLRSASSSFPVSTSSSSGSGDRRDPHLEVETTPKAVPRTRSNLRRTESNLLRSVHRWPNGYLTGKLKGKGKDGLFRSRSKSMGGEKEERKARFGDQVKSPGKALINRRTRRASTQSSTYTTKDTSPPANPGPNRQTPRRRRSVASRHATPFNKSARKEDVEVVDHESTDDESDDDEADPTPIVQRLRSRARNSFVKEPSSELEADAEEESEADAQSEASPLPARRLRSTDKLIDSSGPAPQRKLSRSNSRLTRERGAKRKALEALKGGESDTDGMEVDVGGLAIEDEEGREDEEEMDQDESPRSGPLTRSQLRAKRDEPEGVGSESEDDADTSRERVSTSLTPLSPEEDDAMSVEETEEAATDDAIERQTRSGKTFGTWQSRRNRLRQEALDDPDMEVDGDSDGDETDDAIEADVDLADATLSSLVRLLRDELVQMCESRGIEVGGTKPQLAQALLDWRDEQNASEVKSTTSSQATARPKSSSRTKSKSKKIIHAVASNVHVSGKATPVLLRDHVHATDPATPPHSDDSKRTTTNEADLNFDLSELGLEDSMIKPEQLHKLEKIGSGGFKDVYVGKLRGRKVAVSEFREHLSEMDIRELKLLAEFSHPNIVRFRGICIPEDNSQIPCMLVSELCENGDLFDYIRNVPCPPLKRVLALMLDIARGLEYLHTRKPAIIHRDCKSSNILINRSGQAKVGDFGLARVKHSTRSMIRSLVGTVNWQAPELWHPHPQYDYKVDVFSAAVVYWEMLSNWIGEKKYPWEGHNEHYIYDAVGQKHQRPSVDGLREHWGDEPVNLMERMWHQDPGERPTMTDVVVDLEVLVAECTRGG